MEQTTDKKDRHRGGDRQAGGSEIWGWKEARGGRDMRLKPQEATHICKRVSHPPSDAVHLRYECRLGILCVCMTPASIISAGGGHAGGGLSQVDILTHDDAHRAFACCQSQFCDA